MKKYIVFLLPVILLSVASCHKHQDTPPPSPPVLQIHDFSPLRGPVFSVITLNGHFDVNPVVKINGTAATNIVMDSAATKITCTVPQGATSGKITVSFASGTVLTSDTMFTVSSPTWTQVADSSWPNPYVNGVSFVLGNKIYYGLGYSSLAGTYPNYTPAFNTDFKIFDPATGKWSQGPVIPAAMSPRANACAFVLNGKAYIVFGNRNVYDDWEYDPAKTGDAAWRRIPDYPGTSSGSWGGVAFTWNNKGYTGVKGSHMYSYDPAGNGTWAQANTIFIYPYFSNWFVTDSTFHIIGGLYDDPGILGIVSWGIGIIIPSGADVPFHEFPYKMVSQPSFSLYGKGYILYKGATYEYDPAANTWNDINDASPSFEGSLGLGYNVVLTYGIGNYSYTYNAAVVNGQAYAWTPLGKIFNFGL